MKFGCKVLTWLSQEINFGLSRVTPSIPCLGRDLVYRVRPTSLNVRPSYEVQLGLDLWCLGLHIFGPTCCFRPFGPSEINFLGLRDYWAFGKGPYEIGPNLENWAIKCCCGYFFCLWLGPQFWFILGQG